ncbi:MAG: endonuclease domain-containing protein [Candidatus Levybacteria bacterium]|nr:endonuclease domain-containing protein [Candidatus Levybacteria bacterium]
MKNDKFTFKGHSSNLEKGEAVFHFSLEHNHKNVGFQEKISFPPVTSAIPSALLKSILDNLMLILGISYWKTYCPKNIIIEDNFLTKKQAEFWNTVYTKGMGEFFYKNNIDFRGLIKFPFVESVKVLLTPYPRRERSLLLLGGGKDSIVAAEILKKQEKDFDLFMTGTSQIQEDVAEVMNKKPIVFKRELDPKLFDLNKQEDTFNGHIPISAIYAFLGLLASALYNYSSVVVGNEKSANFGNVEYLGQTINHQWSKSEEFEKLFRNYLKEFITSDVSYSSILRNVTELEVVKEFVKYPKYFKVFSSCNRNFKILKQVQNDKNRWCGECAKCLFVFTLLAAYLSKEEVLTIFGKNLFEDKSLFPIFQELLGIKDFKPFECVGTPEEMKIALKKIKEKGEFNETFGV